MRINLAKFWYHKTLHPCLYLLLPFSWLFALLTSLRRRCYRLGTFKTQRFHVPVIVVGNITVGGTGKTPFVLWLAKFLQAHGWHPGIVSRGVGGEKHITPRIIKIDDAPHQVGDEALLLQRHGNCPVVVCIDRAAAVCELLQHSRCDIVISDDGLQHYGLARDLEIIMVDGARRFGNECLLPAGPLRESVQRLKQADFVIVNEGDAAAEIAMKLQPVQLVSVLDNSRTKTLTEFAGKKVHAVAAIGHPERFFNSLKQAGFEIIHQHIFPDHHLYQASDLHFADDYPILMTEKDAVKCAAFADDRYWYLEVKTELNADFEQQLLTRIKHLETSNEYETDIRKHYQTHTRDLSARD